MGASLLWLAVEAGLTDWPAQRTYYDLTTGVANAIQLTSTIAGIVALVILWWRHWRGPADGRRLVRYTLASIAAFVVFAKVLSPQYLLWLVVLVPALRGARANIATALLAGSTVATAIYFPRWFPSVYDGLASYGLATIAVRNLLLAMFLVALLWRIEGRAENRGPRREAAVRSAAASRALSAVADRARDAGERRGAAARPDPRHEARDPPAQEVQPAS
jgi:hypothetical protein